MKIIQTIDDHFKENLGSDYRSFYWEWIRFLSIPIIIFASLALLQWLGGVQ